MSDREKKVIVWSDDDPAIHETVRFLLESQDYELHFVATTAETIDLARRLAPDLVVTDMQKPEKEERESGVRIAETLRADPQLASIPILLCSGYITKGYADNPLFDATREKPVTQEELIDAVRRLLKE